MSRSTYAISIPLGDATLTASGRTAAEAVNALAELVAAYSGQPAAPAARPPALTGITNTPAPQARPLPEADRVFEVHDWQCPVHGSAKVKPSTLRPNSLFCAMPDTESGGYCKHESPKPRRQAAS